MDILNFGVNQVSYLYSREPKSSFYCSFQIMKEQVLGVNTYIKGCSCVSFKLLRWSYCRVSANKRKLYALILPFQRNK